MLHVVLAYAPRCVGRCSTLCKTMPFEGLKKSGKNVAQMAFPLDVKPCALHPFPLGCFDVDLCVVDEEALFGRTSYLADGMTINLGGWLGKAYFVGDEDVVEEVGASVALLMEEAALYLLPVQVVGV